MHDQKPSCPFCLIGFTNQGALMKHVEQSHGENTPVIRENTPVIRENTPVIREKRLPINQREKRKGSCIFYLQSRGCKKGSQCDFSHDRDSHYTIVKIRKECRNGSDCTWKPRCRYVHTEVGEIIPPRFNREEPRVQREEVRVTREEGRLPMGEVRVTREEGTLPRKEVRVTRTEASRQGFVNPASLQPPPENTMKNYPVLKRPQSSDWLKLWAKH